MGAAARSHALQSASGQVPWAAAGRRESGPPRVRWTLVLKQQTRLEHHLARTPAGLAVRIAQRILTLTLGILLNTISGRPARALAAYDGR